MKKIILHLKILLIGFSVTTFAQQNNVLIIIADDLGVDYMSTYEEGSDFASTPNINTLSATGIQFNNAWSNPACSPTRAGILTGRYGFRTGITNVVGGRNGGQGINTEEFTLPDVIKASLSGYTNACIGKWHLSDDTNGGEDNPNLMGFDYYSGLLTGASNYFEWNKTTNGLTATVSNYATSENVDDAIRWIDQQAGPWFQWLAFTNPHTPFHLPPAELHSFDNLSGSFRDIRTRPIPYFKAMVEAMDTEIGRLFQHLKQTGQFDNTNIIFIGDNGTTEQVVQAPFDPNRSKTTLYEGGVNVPMIISGPAVNGGGRQSNALINTLDTFATSLDLMGINTLNTIPGNIIIDSKSLLPIIKNESTAIRNWVFSELSGLNEQNDGKTIRNTTFKLIKFDNGIEEFYNLNNDPFENNNLLSQTLSANAQNNYIELSDQLNQLTGATNMSNTTARDDRFIDVWIYPNPSSEQITISVSDEVGTFKYNIVDIYGNITISGSSDNKIKIVSVTEIDPALYFIEIEFDKKKIIKRFLKK